jgi:hypothetical protein
MRLLIAAALAVLGLVTVTNSAFASTVVFQADNAVPKKGSTNTNRMVTCTVSDANMEHPMSIILLAARSPNLWSWLPTVSDPPFILDFYVTLDGSRPTSLLLTGSRS